MKLFEYNDSFNLSLILISKAMNIFASWYLLILNFVLSYKKDYELWKKNGKSGRKEGRGRDLEGDQRGERIRKGIMVKLYHLPCWCELCLMTFWKINHEFFRVPWIFFSNMVKNIFRKWRKWKYLGDVKNRIKLYS